ncbi:unnamed protein product [Vitrella brassicaformis CCMP3155]|uniref:Amine oxidase domain-containing protein n=1 Tax=Vitrella brassicaformis (strain CCMP3155) TaxID=1169540 RepID=A0A0G4F9P0_VITBC|nr:unnamed protein product [Vitrella brassicaformis CCMP3155]|eukprot:CEM09634.1 unnamed protein product [Vitrella brassicaformis CCMP3155]
MPRWTGPARSVQSGGRAVSRLQLLGLKSAATKPSIQREKKKTVRFKEEVRINDNGTGHPLGEEPRQDNMWSGSWVAISGRGGGGDPPLKKRGYDVTILEACERVGDRIHTHRFSRKGGLPENKYDLAANWMHIAPGETHYPWDIAAELAVETSALTEGDRLCTNGYSWLPEFLVDNAIVNEVPVVDHEDGVSLHMLIFFQAAGAPGEGGGDDVPGSRRGPPSGRAAGSSGGAAGSSGRRGTDETMGQQWGKWLSQGQGGDQILITFALHPGSDPCDPPLSHMTLGQLRLDPRVAEYGRRPSSRRQRHGRRGEKRPSAASSVTTRRGTPRLTPA